MTTEEVDSLNHEDARYEYRKILVRLVKEMEFILEWHRIETIPLREQEISRIEALVLEGKNLLEG